MRIKIESRTLYEFDNIFWFEGSLKQPLRITVISIFSENRLVNAQTSDKKELG